MRIVMTNVVKLQTARRTRAEHKTLCRAGFQPLLRLLRPRHSHIPVQHKWQVVTEGRFDVKQASSSPPNAAPAAVKNG